MCVWLCVDCHMLHFDFKMYSIIITHDCATLSCESKDDRWIGLVEPTVGATHETSMAEMKEKVEWLECMVMFQAQRIVQLEAEFEENIDEAVSAKLQEAAKERFEDAAVNELVEKAVRAKLAGDVELELDGLLQGNLMKGVAAQLKEDLEIEQKARYDAMDETIDSLKDDVGRLRHDLDMRLAQTQGNVTNDEDLHPSPPLRDAYAADAKDLNSHWHDVE
jgi:hypothetical protein